MCESLRHWASVLRDSSTGSLAMKIHFVVYAGAESVSCRARLLDVLT